MWSLLPKPRNLIWRNLGHNIQEGLKARGLSSVYEANSAIINKKRFKYGLKGRRGGLGSPFPLLTRHYDREDAAHSLVHSCRRQKSYKTGRDDLSHLFVPVPIKARTDEINVGEEIVGPLDKKGILRTLNNFYSSENIRELSREHGLDDYLYQQTFISFRKFCLESESLPVDLHIILSDILQGAAHIHDIYPSFRRHALNIFPHLNCLDDLCKISDMTTPPNWYPQARALNRKIIFHAGPTNSGKTYHAMEQFLSANSGIYCGPLKLLASEVFTKSNEKGTPCDLLTGEEIRFGSTDGASANHISCTVEMTSMSTPYEVAIIDEIQMMKDPQRGWAWTRALLGVCAQEVHLCGETSAINLVQELAMTAGEEVEVRKYKRLTPLIIESAGLQRLDNIHPGDCIVCFSKKDILRLSQEIEKRGHEVAVIYGGLPPGTKLAQAYKFNDPKHKCKVLVATDAIGMGLNLSIRRIIFNSLIKPIVSDKGELEMETISVSTALQIAGRAGRYGTQWEKGYVTTMRSEDLPTLQNLLGSDPEEVKIAGIKFTAEQIELFAYHLPNYAFSNLIDIYTNICTVDSTYYFMCMMDDFKFLADLIEHIPLQLQVRYVFCCAPISRKIPFVCAMFLKFARRFSQNEPVTLDWLCHQVKWPIPTPNTIAELVHLEEVFDVFDLYLWFSNRFIDMFPNPDIVQDLHSELDGMIEKGVSQITMLLGNSSPRSSSLADTEDVFLMDQKKKKKERAVKISKVKRKKDKQVSHARLADKLIAHGVISPKLMIELRKEWSNEDFKGNNKDRTPPENPKGVFFPPKREK